MSKISYCSLEEAWGSTYKSSNNQNTDNNYQIETINKKENDKKNGDKCNNGLYNEKIYSLNNDDKYSLLYKKSEGDRKNVINNMNNIERHNSKKYNNEQNSLVEYNKYRLNSSNVVKESTNSEDDYALQKYMPFSESIEKKYLQDKLKFLENEILKYKHLIENNENVEQNNYIESFSNQGNNSSSSSNNMKNNDLIDIILLIIIGLIIILVMNSIFNIGKAIGVRNK
jgi:hypothetical protein